VQAVWIASLHYSYTIVGLRRIGLQSRHITIVSRIQSYININSVVD